MEQSDLAALNTLHALLQESSVTRAARRLALSTPAVSHALARLRERFDDPLLVRAGRMMVLTPFAERLKPLVADAVSAAQLVYREQGAFNPTQMQRTFTVSATDYVLLVFGARFDAAVASGAPHLNLRFVPNAADDARRLRESETDIAIGIYGELPPELKTRAIITDRFVCVVRDGHPTIGAKLTLDQFTAAEHIQIAPRGRPGGYLDELLHARGLRRRVARAVPYFQVALEMTASSDRVLTVSERIVHRLGPQLGVRVLEPPLPLEPFALSMVWHPRFDADPGHRWLRDQFVAVTKAMDGVQHDDARRNLSATDPTSWS